MQIVKRKKDEINDLIGEFENHIIYYFDELKHGKGSVDIDINNINEAFFFNDNRCLHLYREEDLKGILYIADGNEDVLIEEQLGKEDFKPLKKIVVKKYINYDEDGQAYISRVLPSKLIYQGE